MDNFIIRWYNQNRKMIWIVILTIVAIIALIQTLDNYYKNNPKEESSSTNSTTAYNANNNYSVITREEVDETISEESIDLIERFLDNCNKGQIEYAYNLISAQCKEELYPTLEDFETTYHKKIFTKQKNYDSMLWIATSNRHTYRIEIVDDLLATGGNKNDLPTQDYYTIVYENGNYKLNINSFVGKEYININESKNNINIDVLSRTIYMDYEIYEIAVQNNTGSELIFNTKQNTNSMYIQDENGLKYISFLNEIPDNELEILNGITKNLKIKFNRGYKPKINIDRIVFEDINNNGQIEYLEIEL